MHVEYAWVSSMLATGDAIDVAKCISGGSDRARLEKNKDEKLCVSGNISSLEHTFYKNTIFPNGMCFMLVRNIQEKDVAVEVVTECLLATYKLLYSKKEGRKKKERDFTSYLNFDISNVALIVNKIYY